MSKKEKKEVKQDKGKKKEGTNGTSADHDEIIKVPLTTKYYEEELVKLQIELVKLQEWIKYKGLRVVVLFEGRDAAGKGGRVRAEVCWQRLRGASI